MSAVIVDLLELFLLVLVAYAILSWVVAASRPSYDSPLLKVERVLGSVCEPVLRPVRKVIPPVRLGDQYLDLSVLVLWLVITFVLIPIFG